MQRVTQARVEVNQTIISQIGIGLLVLVGIEKEDDEAKANRLLEKLLGYRIFPDTAGKMNLSLSDIRGELLIVPQFTLAADTRKGMRPSFSCAASAEKGNTLFAYLLEQAKSSYPKVAAGIFAADMQISLTNDGPVTFWLTV